MRIADALNSHLNINVKLAGLSPKTVESYEVSAKHITDFFGADTNIATITLDDVAAYFEHLKLWQSLDTTKAYTHLTDNNLRRVYDKVAQNY